MKVVFSFNHKDKNNPLNNKFIYTEKWEEETGNYIDIFNQIGEKFTKEDGQLDLESCYSFLESEKWCDVHSKSEEENLEPMIKFMINEDCTIDLKHREDTYKRKIFPEELAFKKRYGDKRQWFFDSIENYFLENQNEIPENINRNNINEKRKNRYEKLISMIEEIQSNLKSDNPFNKIVILPALDTMLDTTKKIFSGKDYNLSLGKRVLRLVEVIESEESSFESKNNCDFYYVTCYLKKL
ncbi:hypothetical protein OAK75_00700 [Bacteriovoracales bacterium]|nr:hypothetical protein [Bacteriovoracales bacterium]